MRIRPYAADDRDAALALAGRLREGVAPWRSAERVLAAVIEWVRASVDSAADGPGAVLVAAHVEEDVRLTRSLADPT